jgi:hypothetical protein
MFVTSTSEIWKAAAGVAVLSIWVELVFGYSLLYYTKKASTESDFLREQEIENWLKPNLSPNHHRRPTIEQSQKASSLDHNIMQNSQHELNGLHAALITAEQSEYSELYFIIDDLHDQKTGMPDAMIS